jgi:AbrB family looped-hinge helix DNA binding protein
MQGIVRRLDSLGRIVVPKEIRKSLAYAPDQAFDISVEDDKVILTPTDTECYPNHCKVCGCKKSLLMFNKNGSKFSICSSCQEIIEGK